MLGALSKMALEMVNRAESIDMPKCKFCQSMAVVKNGKRNGTQYYICKMCGRGFVYNKGLPRMRYPTDIVADAVYDYYAGESLNKITDGIQQRTGSKPSDSAIYGWVERLTKIGLNEARKFTPKLGDTYQADETVIRLKDKRNKYWLINMIDSDTRFLLASVLCANRGMTEITKAFETAKERAGKSPKYILTDGWKVYPDAIERVFGSDTKHILTTPFETEQPSTNIVERWHGTLKDRLKPMRGMDKSKTKQLVLEGLIFYYNFLRPHESLNGKTPAEVAGINFPFKNWDDIIKSEMPKPPELKKPKTLEEMKHPFIQYRKRNKLKAKRKIQKLKARSKAYPSVSVTRY